MPTLSFSDSPNTTFLSDDPIPISTGYAVAYGKDNLGVPLWVCLGSSSRAVYSYDPSATTNTWVATASIFASVGLGIAFGKNGAGTDIWVATGNDTNYRLATSTNGKTWTLLTNTVFGDRGNDVAYDGTGRWVAVGNTLSSRPTVITSTDATTWSTINSIHMFSENGKGVNHGIDDNGNGLWVAAGASAGPKCIFSPDGINWLPGTGLTGLTIGNGVACGKDSSGVTLWVLVGAGTNTIFTSRNGKTWSPVAGTKFSEAGESVSYGNNKWVATGLGTNTILQSADGLTWSAITTGTLFPTAGYGMVYGGIYWVAAGISATGILYALDGDVPPTPTSPPCFMEGSKILTDKGYVPIENLRKGDKVQTLNAGFVPIYAIGKRIINHQCAKERIPDQMYVCSTKNYPQIFEDLVITGYHSLLSEDFENEDQKEETKKVLGKIYITEGQYRIPICIDKRAEVYDKKGDVMIYHFALEHSSYVMNYGVYANGLLVESTSKRYLLEFSGMTLLE